MKKLLILPAVILLASCAPTVQQDPVYTANRAYAADCTQVLGQLDAVALRTRPGVVFGASGWPTLTMSRKTDSGAIYVSNAGSFGVAVTATCTPSTSGSILRLDTSGQRQAFADALNTALLDGIR